MEESLVFVDTPEAEPTPSLSASSEEIFVASPPKGGASESWTLLDSFIDVDASLVAPPRPVRASPSHRVVVIARRRVVVVCVARVARRAPSRVAPRVARDAIASPRARASIDTARDAIARVARSIGRRSMPAVGRRSAAPFGRGRRPARSAHVPHTDERATTVLAVARVCSELQRPLQPGQPPCQAPEQCSAATGRQVLR